MNNRPRPNETSRVHIFGPRQISWRPQLDVETWKKTISWMALDNGKSSDILGSIHIEDTSWSLHKSQLFVFLILNPCGLQSCPVPTTNGQYKVCEGEIRRQDTFVDVFFFREMIGCLKLSKTFSKTTAEVYERLR